MTPQPTASPLAPPVICPGCRQPMAAHRFERTPLGEVEIDLCFTCRGIWFDGFESAQITPGGIIALFRLIHEKRDALIQPLPDRLPCPRCRETLLVTADRGRSGQFTYQRCLQKHGRFISFSQFMIEKGFVRQLSPMERDALAARIGTVRCDGCGAPVDIRHDAVCTHCRAPIAILDPEAIEQALAGYHHAEIRRTTANPEALADALLARHRKDKPAPGPDTPLSAMGLGDLIGAGIGLIAALLSR